VFKTCLRDQFCVQVVQLLQISLDECAFVSIGVL